MTQTDDTRSPSEELLCASLRRLARTLPQEAPLELEDVLVQAFHRRRRRRRAIRGLAIAAILATCSVPLWRRFAPEHRTPANQVAVETQSVPAGGPVAKLPSLDTGEAFLALPSFAFVTPEEDLRVIRVEMPVYSLRLLGARVNDELSTQRVVADLLVGADGTPYAFRLVS